MRKFRGWTWSRTLLGASAAVVSGMFWINFAPPHLGGDSVYVVTSGISMEPRFHTGDLAILRPTGSYRVGEIVGYRSPKFGIVMHRIIGDVNGHFLMKGDNNNFVDSYHPTPSDVVGRLWLHVPKIGRLINTQRNRETSVAVAALAMTAVIGVPVEQERRRRRKHRRRSDEPIGAAAGGRPPSRRSSGGGLATGVLGATGQVVASIVLIVALGALVLAALSFTRSTTTTTTAHLAYQQSGTWAYSAPATGDVYANGVVATGQPIYLSIAPVLKVSFHYQFASLLPASLTGRAELSAVLSRSDGWSHTLLLGPTKSFSGAGVIVTGILDLRTIENYLTSVATQIGQVGGSSTVYSVSVQPNVHVAGVLGGSLLQSQVFNPPMSFTLLSNEAQLNYGQGASNTLAQVVQPSLAGTVSVPRTTPATVSLFGLHPSVSASRQVALWILAAALLALMILGLLLRKAYRAAETDRITARYGALLVSVQRPDELGSVGTTRVATLEDLVKIAEFQGRLILHCESEVGRDYFVRDQTTTYLYSVRDESSEDATVPEGVGFAVSVGSVAGHGPTNEEGV